MPLWRIIKWKWFHLVLSNGMVYDVHKVYTWKCSQFKCCKSKNNRFEKDPFCKSNRQTLSFVGFSCLYDFVSIWFLYLIVIWPRRKSRLIDQNYESKCKFCVNSWRQSSTEFSEQPKKTDWVAFVKVVSLQFGMEPAYNLNHIVHDLLSVMDTT